MPHFARIVEVSTLRDLIDMGLLSPNAELIWKRKSISVTHTAYVQPDGSLRTSDGVAHKTPSGAARHFGQKPIDGWNVWRLKDSNVTLASLREQISN